MCNAFAMHLLTMLGTAGEDLGMDRHLTSNTSKTRMHSLFHQGCILYELIPNMPEIRLRPPPHAALRRHHETLRRNPQAACSLVR